MKLQKKFYLFAILLASTFCLSACQKNEIESRTEGVKDAISEENFAYTKKIKLEDGNYYRFLVVSSNRQEQIDDFISRNPKIEVKKIDDNSEFKKAESGSLETGLNANSNGLDSISIKFTDGNIPSGYIMKFYFSESGSNSSGLNKGARVMESNQNYNFVDDLAKGVYTSVGGNYKIQHYYYSKGPYWYSFGYYDRGYRTLQGPYGSYTFYASAYTTYPGTKFTFSTTPSAANASYHYFTY